MAIGQQLSLPILVPLALERLEQNPLLEADHYEGDLLKFVFMVKAEFWTVYPDLWRRTDEIARLAWSLAMDLDDCWREDIEPDLAHCFAMFLERKP